jgi:DNA polymerase-1
MLKTTKNTRARGGKMIIIDGNALIHRSFHALPQTMATKKGEIVNAVYGFTLVLLKAIKEFKPEYLVLTLDKKGPTFRHIAYKEYKATRVKAPDELYMQIPRVREVAEAFDIPVFAESGYEADDLIGTIASSVDSDIEKIIVTGDMDTLQLVNSHTKVYTMSRGLSDSVLYDIHAVKERYGGLAPEQMVDYKALRGDPSDNIPGVKGIGEKTAIEILKNFVSLDNLYNYIEAKTEKIGQDIPQNKGLDKIISPRIKDLLIVHKREAYLSQKLATIKRDVALDFTLEAAKFHQFDTGKVTDLFSELEFRSLLPRIKEIVFDKDVSREQVDKFARNQNDFKYELVDDEKKFALFFAKLKKQLSFTFDTETSGINPITAELLGISFSWQAGEAYYVMIQNSKCKTHDYDAKTADINLFNYHQKKSQSLPEREINPWIEKLRPIFENDKIKKHGHNMKFDIRVLLNNGIYTKGIAFDTMIASYLLHPGTRQHNLDAVVFGELGFEKINKEDLLGKSKEKIDFQTVATEKLALYSCEDADFTQRLVEKLSWQMKDDRVEELFTTMEMPLVEVLAEMEQRGIKIDEDHLREVQKKTAKQIDTLEKNIHSLANSNFNINSTQQLRAVLFEKLALPIAGISKTKTGFSTGADELEKLKETHEIIPLIQNYRELAKLQSTYIEALPKLVNQKTQRIHTSYNQAVTATGRLSSTEPNLQNIPIRTELGREIRQTFIAEKGFQLLSLDYSQIELRVAAHMSGDEKMIAAFQDNVDIHTATAAEINNVSLGAVTEEMRREAKATNFGVLYGQGAHGLSQTADISYARAKEFIDNYFVSFAGVKKFIDTTIENARLDGYVATLFGRKRSLPEINAASMQMKKAAERMAINTPIQGTAADMIKMAMIKVKELIDKKYINDEARMLLQVHDELLFEIKSGFIAILAEDIKDIMENIVKLKVPLKVDVKIGNNWGKMTKIKDYKDVV